MHKHQKQSFANVLQDRCSWKFSKFHGSLFLIKSLVLESLFNEVAGLYCEKQFQWQNKLGYEISKVTNEITKF